MKAMVFDTFGDTSVLHWTTFPDPTPAPGNAIIEVSRVGLNHLDLMARAGEVGKIPLPHISGSEVVGKVVDVGAHDSRELVGQRVAVAPYLFCGMCKSCLDGHETTCLRSDIVGLHSMGGFAQYMAAPLQNLLPIPESLSDSEAAALTLSTVTAYHMLVDRVKVRPGDVVLVWAAGSGVGSAAVQIARLLGAEVIATAGSDAKVERAIHDLHAHWGVNYRTEDVVARVRDITGKRGVDIVFEHIGQETLPQSVKMLSRQGRIVTCGTLTGGHGEVDLWTLFAKELQLVGAYGGSRGNLRDVLKWAASGSLKAVIDQEFTLEDLALAEQHMENRAQFGKIIIRV